MILNIKVLNINHNKVEIGYKISEKKSQLKKDSGKTTTNLKVLKWQILQDFNELPR